MRITCPTCHTNYEVPAARVGSVPTAARCTRCKREFTVIPPDEPDPPAPVAFEPVVIPRPPEPPPLAPADLEPEPPRVPLANPFRAAPERGPPPPERGHRGALIGWVVSIVILAALVGLIILFRGGTMAAWPPSQRLFHLFGSR